MRNGVELRCGKPAIMGSASAKDAVRGCRFLLYLYAEGRVEIGSRGTCHDGDMYRHSRGGQSGNRAPCPEHLIVGVRRDDERRARRFKHAKILSRNRILPRTSVALGKRSAVRAGRSRERYEAW